MSLYSIALFLHIVGAVLAFAALGLEWMTLYQMRQATTAEAVREWAKIPRLLGRIGPVSMLTILAPGIYMTATAWGGVAWIGVAFVAMLSFPILGRQSGMRLGGILRDMGSASGPLSDAVAHRLREASLWTSVQVRAALLLGIIFLMTIKPDLIGSLATIGVSLALGFLVSLPARSQDRLGKAPELGR